MISDNIEDPGDELFGPYYLWRLLIDQRFQGRGYGSATIEHVFLLDGNIRDNVAFGLPP